MKKNSLKCKFPGCGFIAKRAKDLVGNAPHVRKHLRELDTVPFAEAKAAIIPDVPDFTLESVSDPGTPALVDPSTLEHKFLSFVAEYEKDLDVLRVEVFRREKILASMKSTKRIIYKENE